MTIALLRSITRSAKRHRMPSWTPDAVRRATQQVMRKLHERYHLQTMKAAISGRACNLDDIASFQAANAVAMTSPLVLISQAQRSGGSLLNQLSDGHPALAVCPNELHFGFAEQDRWPQFDPKADTERLFEALFDLQLTRLMRKGFHKGGKQVFSADTGGFVTRDIRTQRFLYVPSIHYAIFKELVAKIPERTERAVLDAFFSGFFNAWLDYQGRLQDKTRIVAFAPRFAIDEANVSSFFAGYPDGYLIQIVRDPRTWYPSARNHMPTAMRGTARNELLALWQESAQSIARNRERHGGRVIVLTFEQLLGETERTMRNLSAVLGVAFDPALLTPTVNGSPVEANSSFANQQGGVVNAPLARAGTLDEEERALIERECVPLYQALVKQALTDGEADAVPRYQLSRQA
jgi:hypothetical protein